MKEIAYKDLDINVIEAIKDNWFLLTAKNDGINTMTCSWGTIGHLWNKNVVTVYVRPQRYTKKFIDEAKMFTISFIDGHKDDLIYLGRHSGRDEDKIAKTNLHLTTCNGYDTFLEANLMLVCKILYVNQLDEKCFIDDNIVNSCYQLKDFSIQYIAEIIKIYKK